MDCTWCRMLTVTEALAGKEREVQMYLAYPRDEGDAQQTEADCYKVHPDEKKKRKTRLTMDDRRTGKNLRRPHQLVAVDGVGGAKKEGWKKISLQQTEKRCRCQGS